MARRLRRNQTSSQRPRRKERTARTRPVITIGCWRGGRDCTTTKVTVGRGWVGTLVAVPLMAIGSAMVEGGWPGLTRSVVLLRAGQSQSGGEGRENGDVSRVQKDLLSAPRRSTVASLHVSHSGIAAAHTAPVVVAL